MAVVMLPEAKALQPRGVWQHLNGQLVPKA